MRQKNIERYQPYLDVCWHNAKIGDLLPEEEIYHYVVYLHRDYDDFVDGDLAERIQKYQRYELRNLDIQDVEAPWAVGDPTEFMEMFEKTGTYPPIIVDHTYEIIDGQHRYEALKELGASHILAWVGTRNILESRALSFSEFMEHNISRI